MTALKGHDVHQGPDLNRPWLDNYPPGVPAAINEQELETLPNIFRKVVHGFADKCALESFGARMTYTQLGHHADAITGWLQSRGLVKGDRVAVMLPNIAAYPAILFGVLNGGYTAVNVNPLYTARELLFQLRDSAPKILFVLENFAALAEQVREETGLEDIVVVRPGDMLGIKGTLINVVSLFKGKTGQSMKSNRLTLNEVLGEGEKHTPKPVVITLDDIAFLQYTGGTTGRSKGAMLSHRSVAANIDQCRLWMEPRFGSSELIMVTALPLYHIFGLVICCLLMVRLGGKQILIADPRDLDSFVKILASQRFTLFAGVNTLYRALLDHPKIRNADFSKVIFCMSGGMATHTVVARRWKELTGSTIIEGYGLSETSPVVSVNPLDSEDFSGTVGFPVPSTDVVVRTSDGTDVSTGMRGELCVKGPQVMTGYWHRPEETAAAMTSDGYFKTGDVAILDDVGRITIVDRLKDMILVSGFNVYPNEVEDVLTLHPAVREAAVVGMLDEQGCETIWAHVVLKDHEHADASEILAFCRENMTAYKVPKRIVFRDSLPKSNVGKLLRRVLKGEVV